MIIQAPPLVEVIIIALSEIVRKGNDDPKTSCERYHHNCERSYKREMVQTLPLVKVTIIAL